MIDLTRSEQHIAEQTVCVMLMRGTLPDGQPVFAYIAVRADRIDQFMHAQHQPGFNPEDYGMILESGFGEPTPEIIAKMEQEYGFNHEGMVHLSEQPPMDNKGNDTPVN